MNSDDARTLAYEMARLIWQPIGTAPVNQRVELGRWERFMGKTTWEIEISVARKRFLGVPYRTFEGEKYTHWRPAPPPPTPERDA